MTVKNSLFSGALPFPNSVEWKSFYSADLKTMVKKFITFSPNVFEKMGEQMAFNLFHNMAKRVPAYKDYLKSNKINSQKIKTFSDLRFIPWIDKENYLKKYPLKDLCWDGKLTAPIISASSGSSGQPFFWPRSSAIEKETSYIYELFLRFLFDIGKVPTLLINGFSMGIYIGGTFTLNCSMRLHQKGYPLTIMTPGIHQEEILKIVEKIGGNYGQIILGGYPPFIRDILDAGEKRGINWKKKNIKFIFASESLSEEFRSYLYSKVGISNSSYLTSSMNLYGTADAAVAGHEMPLSILIRKLFSKNAERTQDFFSKTYVPSLNQYYPFFKYFQTENGELIFSTSHNEIPLLKYNIHDRGNIISYENMLEIARSFGYNTNDLNKLVGKQLLWRLPYVYLYGRSDFTTTLYGLNIYPENIKAALETPAIRHLCSGKFVMETKNRAKTQKQYLAVRVELASGIKPSKSLERKFQQVIVTTLRKKNSEFNHLFHSIKNQALPDISLNIKGEGVYFKPSIKQQWVNKIKS